MGDITQYVHDETRGFDELPFNAVDALALSAMVYQPMPDGVAALADITERYDGLCGRMRAVTARAAGDGEEEVTRPIVRVPFGGVTLADVAGELSDEDYGIGVERTGITDPVRTKALFDAASRSPRYAGIKVGARCEYLDHERQTQFAAVTMLLPGGTLAVVFRGTDDSMTGWHEDFNMAYQYPVPAQTLALEYVRCVARLWRGPLVLAGHSKGGNLAVYAAVNAPARIRRRMLGVYSMDGPGLPEPCGCSAGWRDLAGRIVKIVPEASIVGLIFDDNTPCRVVESDRKGFMQHVPFSWQVDGDDFRYRPSVSPVSRSFSRSFNGWIGRLAPERRRRTVESLFGLLQVTGRTSVDGLASACVTSAPGMMGAFLSLPREERRTLLRLAVMMLGVVTGLNVLFTP